MNKLICLAASWLPLVNCFAQAIHPPFSDVYTGMGVYSRNYSDVFSFPVNQASLARMKETSGGIYSERLYSMKELTLYSGAFVKPLPKGAVGISTRYTGNNYFQFFKMGIAYGLSLSEDIDIGLQFNYSTIGIPGYGSAQRFTAEMGTIFRVSDQVVCGFHLSNFSLGFFKQDQEGMPAAIYSFGMGYEVSEKLLIKCDISKEDDMAPILIPGIQYNIKKEVFIRAGIISETGAFVAGAGLKWRNIRTDLAALWHTRLGISPSLIIIFSLSNH